MENLSISSIKAQFVQALTDHNRIILSAPTGSGKSTQIPQILKDHCEIQGKILTLQPRRMATRMLATRVAKERNSTLGREIGFQTRFESKISPDTRILFITEGILPRMLLSNPRLLGIDVIILDEFHERSIYTDIGLGLVKTLQEKSRADLKLIIMSATLETGKLRNFLPDHFFLRCEGRQFPIEVRYSSIQPKQAIWDSAAKALQSLISSRAEGDVLIFMPGVFEINKTIEACKNLRLSEKCEFFPLYGNLPFHQQDQVIAPIEKRKVIVSTNIAETSLTIPGIRNVIDSGLARINRFDPIRGFNSLNIERISQASASQRAGRAGRLAPGKCLRLWSRAEHERKSENVEPEIHRIDLSEPVLYVLAAGFDDLHQFPWLTPPTQEAIKTALTFLNLLGAMNSNDMTLTKLGQKLAQFPAHPRIARMFLESINLGCTKTCTLVAAVLSERSIILSTKQALHAFYKKFNNTLPGITNDSPQIKADAFAVIQALYFARSIGFSRSACQKVGLNADASRQVWKTYDFFLKVCNQIGIGCEEKHPNAEDILKCLLMGFPDRLARRRDSGSLICILRDGRLGELDKRSTNLDSHLLLPLQINEIGQQKGVPKLRLSMVCEVNEGWLIDLFPEHWEFEKVIHWNSITKIVEKKQIDRCLGLTIHEKTLQDLDLEHVGDLLAEAILKEGLPFNGWNKEVKAWIQRTHCVGEWFPTHGLPYYDESSKQRILKTLCAGQWRYRDVRDKPCISAVKNLLSFENQKFVEAMAPDKIILPTGRKMHIKYKQGQLPRGNAKIQDLYGLTATPLVAQKKVKVLLEILGPNMRPLQITDDLARFWKTLYPELKKDLSRRYPKHEWR